MRLILNEFIAARKKIEENVEKKDAVNYIDKRRGERKSLIFGSQARR